MAVRNASPHTVNAWRGLNTFISKNNIDETEWIEADNVLVNARGEAEVLRSPKAFGNQYDPDLGTITFGMDEFKRIAGNALIIDYGVSGLVDSVSLLAAGGNPTGIVQFSVNPGNEKRVSLSINNTFHRINGEEFIQFLPDLATVYDNGIIPPTVDPVISYVANGSDTAVITTSLQGSYAFMNSTTGHVSQPSNLSNVLGPTIAGFDLQFTFSGSNELGVDTILFFVTLDGGAIPYLVIAISTGDPVSAANAGFGSATFDIDLSLVTRDTLTPEPIYNGKPLLNGTFMFGWKDRIFLVVNGGLQYSGFESCYIGNPYESWPVLNQLNLPNRTDRVVGGLSTQSGALIFGENDCYLLTGYPSDKVESPQNLIAVTEHIDSMNWNFGIKDPKTAVNTPFGAIWVDQTKRIRLWNNQGVPSEIAQPLRKELDAMSGTMTASWFQHGKNGGYYVVSNGTIVLFIMLYMSAATGQTQFGYGKSTTLAPEAMATVTFDGVERFFFAKANQVWEVLNPDIAGDGWAEGTEIFFKLVIGNVSKAMNFSSLHSVQISGNLEDLIVTHAPMSEANPVEIELTSDLEADTGETKYGVADSDERRYHVLDFKWGIDDRAYRNIDSLTVNVRNSGRVI